VFTPSEPPLGPHNVYVKRKSVETQLDRFVQRKQIPVVWGEYGVGKTSLVRRFFLKKTDEARLVYVASVAGLSLPDIFKVILEHLNYAVELTTTSTTESQRSGGFDARVLTATLSRGAASAKTSQIVVSSPTDTKINQLIRDARLTVVLDEMHKASSEFRASLVDWIKSTRADPGDFTLVLVGTSTDSGRLVTLDRGIDRYIKEMSVDVLTDEEAVALAEEGFDKLGLHIGDELKERLVRSAAGVPMIIQSLCLDSAEEAVEFERSEIIEDDVRHAVEVYLSENESRLYEHYSIHRDNWRKTLPQRDPQSHGYATQ
jgi:hypothetical protein